MISFRLRRSHGATTFDLFTSPVTVLDQLPLCKQSPIHVDMTFLIAFSVGNLLLALFTLMICIMFGRRKGSRWCEIPNLFISNVFVLCNKQQIIREERSSIINAECIHCRSVCVSCTCVHNVVVHVVHNACLLCCLKSNPSETLIRNMSKRRWIVVEQNVFVDNPWKVRFSNQ